MTTTGTGTGTGTGTTNYTSRSAVLDYQACPRLRLLGWELYKGQAFMECVECGNAYSMDDEMSADLRRVMATEDDFKPTCGLCGSPMQVRPAHVGGLAPKRKSIYLVVGEAVHVGLETMLRRVQSAEALVMSPADGPLKNVQLAPQAIDDSAAAALATIDHYGPQGVNLHGCPPEWQDWKYQEQRAMVEGLVRAFGLSVLPNLLERYRVVEVEQECQMPLAPELVFQARIDALLEERDTGDLHILSFKTAKEWGKTQAMQFKRDVQGLTEAMAWEAQHASPDRDLLPADMPRRIAMTQMLILLKSKEYEDKWAGAPGKWVHYSPLTRAYRLSIPGIVPEFDSSKWAWSYDTPKTYQRGDRKGEQYMGTLEKDWKPVSTWDNYPGGMKAWVEDLYKGKWQSEMGDPFAKCFVMPEPWSRAQQEMEDTREQIRWQEDRVVEDVEEYESRLRWIAQPEIINDHHRYHRYQQDLRTFLNQRFPQHRSSCSRYGGMCWADDVCFGTGGGDGAAPFFPVEELLAPGMGRRLRSPHHVVVGGGAGDAG